MHTYGFIQAIKPDVILFLRLMHTHDIIHVHKITFSILYVYWIKVWSYHLFCIGQYLASETDFGTFYCFHYMNELRPFCPPPPTPHTHQKKKFWTQIPNLNHIIQLCFLSHSNILMFSLKSLAFLVFSFYFIIFGLCFWSQYPHEKETLVYLCKSIDKFLCPWWCIISCQQNRILAGLKVVVC